MLSDSTYKRTVSQNISRVSEISLTLSHCATEGEIDSVEHEIQDASRQF